MVYVRVGLRIYRFAHLREATMKAIWNNIVIAESSNTVVVENNHYFPEESVKKEYLQTSNTTTICPWKGTANYYHIQVGDELNNDAVWYYAEPKDAAKQIKGHMAFWKGVEITP